MIGICGASRTGKTTVARDISERTGIPFHTFNTAQIFADAGFPQILGTLPLETRVLAQEAYLDHYEKAIAELPRPCIVDRTPTCCAGYLLSEIYMTHPDSHLGERVKRYLDRAVRITERSFAMLFILRPLPIYVEAPGKAGANLGYQWHSQLTMEGAINQVRNVPCYSVSLTDHEDRVTGMIDTMVARLEDLQKARAGERLH